MQGVNDPQVGAAKCVKSDPRLFDYDEMTVQRLVAARAVCVMCPLLGPCAAAGVTGRETGVWGGLLLHEGQVLVELRRPGRSGRAKLADTA